MAVVATFAIAAASARQPCRLRAFRVEGRSKTFVKVADSGNRGTFHFCPDCGSDVYYDIDGKFDDKFNGLIAIPLGAFDDPFVMQPRFSVWEKRKHDWLEIVGDDVEHTD